MTEMMFALHIIMMAIDGFHIGGKRFRHNAADGIDDIGHHQLAV